MTTRAARIIRQMMKKRPPWHLTCKKCEGGGEMGRAAWDLLPNICNECGGSGRDAIPWTELYPIGRDLCTYAATESPEKKKHPNAKERKKLRKATWNR
jgi:hypothetical protein